MDYLQEFKPYYESQIMPVVKELEKKRTKRLYMTGAISLLSLPFIILYFMLLRGFSLETLTHYIFNYIMFTAMTGIITYFILSACDKSYTQFKLDVIKKIVTYMGDYDYTPGKFIPENVFLQSGIFEKHISTSTTFSSARGNDYACGKIDDIKVEFSELDSHYAVTTTSTRSVSTSGSYGQSTGSTNVTTKNVKAYQLFRGLFFVATFKDRFLDDINMYINEGVISDFRKTLKDGNTFNSPASFRFSDGNLVKIFRDGRTEDAGENERIAELKTYISEGFIEAMKSNNIKGNVFISYRENKMYIGIPLEKDLFENSLRGALLKYEDVMTYFQSINFAVSAFKEIAGVKDIWISDSESKEEKLSRNICPWCEMKDSFVNNMCKKCGYVAPSVRAEVKPPEEKSYEQSEHIRCPSCGGNFPQGTKFCGNCGQNVK